MVTFRPPLNPLCSAATPTCLPAGIRSKVVPEGGRNTWMGVVVITKTGGARHLSNFAFSFIFLCRCFEILKLRKRVEVWKQTVVGAWRDCCVSSHTFTPHSSGFTAADRIIPPFQCIFLSHADILQIGISFFSQRSHSVWSLSVSQGIAWDVLFEDNSLQGPK